MNWLLINISPLVDPLLYPDRYGINKVLWELIIKNNPRTTEQAGRFFFVNMNTNKLLDIFNCHQDTR